MLKKVPMAILTEKCYRLVPISFSPAVPRRAPVGVSTSETGAVVVPPMGVVLRDGRYHACAVGAS